MSKKRKLPKLRHRFYYHKVLGVPVVFVSSIPKERDALYSFNIGVYTKDSSVGGLQHITEHVVLQASHKTPLSMFKLADASIAKEMNASTRADITTYYSKTLEYKDFISTFDYYLNYVYRPLLRKEDIYIEGFHRKIKNNKIYYSGVVFNEMLADYFSRFRSKYYAILEYLSPKGFGDPFGYPPYIVKNVTPTRVKTFYKSHYNPLNTAIVVTGPLTKKQRQNVLNLIRKVIKGSVHNKNLSSKFSMEETQKFEKPYTVTTKYYQSSSEQEPGALTITKVYDLGAKRNIEDRFFKLLVLSSLLQRNGTWLNSAFKTLKYANAVYVGAYTTDRFFILNFNVFGVKDYQKAKEEVESIIKTYIKQKLQLKDIQAGYRSVRKSYLKDFNLGINLAWAELVLESLLLLKYDFKVDKFAKHFRTKRLSIKELQKLSSFTKTLLESKNTQVLYLKPSTDLTAKMHKELENLKQKETKSLTEAKKRQLQELNKKLEEYIKQKNSLLSKNIQIIKPQDVKKGILDPNDFRYLDRYLRIISNAKNTAMFRAYIPMWNLDFEELPYLGIYRMLMSSIPRKFSKEALDLTADLYSFGLGTQISLDTQNNPVFAFKFDTTYLLENELKIAKFFKRYFFEAEFKPTKETLNKIKHYLQEYIRFDADSAFDALRLGVYKSDSLDLRLRFYLTTGFIDLYKDWLKNFDKPSTQERILNHLQNIHAKVMENINNSYAILGNSSPFAWNWFGLTKSGIANVKKQTLPKDWSIYKQLKNMGQDEVVVLKVPTNSFFIVGVYDRPQDLNLAETFTITNFLSNEYVYPTMRAKYNAYGARFQPMWFMDRAYLYVYSINDPNKSIEVLTKTPGFLQNNLKLFKQNFNKSKISAMSDLYQEDSLSYKMWFSDLLFAYNVDVSDWIADLKGLRALKESELIAKIKAQSKPIFKFKRVGLVVPNHKQAQPLKQEFLKNITEYGITQPSIEISL